MEYKVTVAPRALLDLQQIGDYITKDNPQAAHDYISQITEAYQSLSHFPERIRIRDDITPGFRVMPFGNHLLIFSIVQNEVHVLRVIHAARDLPSAFDEE